MSNEFKVIDGAAEIDLTRHAVIEASAGTGKTYTMVELVLRLMGDEEAGLTLDKILLTTFTDNAANELKTRIRTELKDRINKGDLTEVIENRFKQAVQSIESAPIYTIHGFCQRMASEFAFESGEVFDKDLVDGDSVLEARFNVFIRTWPANEVVKSAFQDYLAADDSNNLARLKKTVLQLAGQSNPDFDLIFPPEPEPLPCLESFTLRAELDTLEAEFMQLHTNKGGAPNAYMVKNWQKSVKPLLERLADDSSNNEQKYDYLNQLVADKLTKKSPFEHFFLSAPQAFNDDNWEKNKVKFPVICEQLERVFALLTQIQAKQYFRQCAIIKHCLSYLDTDVSHYLEQQGQVTYDHIIRQLFNLLQRERTSESALLTEAIRRKFSVVMIDEFQDTDPYQWHIFKWLFLAQDPSEHRLWVIGDPKQSIYGFRGADVSTYMNAREVMQQTGALSYRLNTNYRSIPALVTGFNHFFSVVKDPDSPAYWYPEDSIKVEAANRDKIPELPRLEQDNSGLAAFNYIPLDVENKADSRRTELADQIAETIQERLVGRLKISLKNKSKLLNYDDICILVKANQDSIIIKKACQALDIPVSIQRSKGLYQQPEAIQFEVLLSALHQPHNSGRVHNALSGVFFASAYSNPNKLSDSAQQQINQDWLQLLQWAKSGEWVAVFDWLIDGSGTRLRAAKEGDNRRLANLTKIANTLCRYGLQHNAGTAELLRFYKKLRLTAVERDEDDQNQDTDQQAVKVMTMHGAKGLEFPVVFLFDGLTGPSNTRPYHKFYDIDLQATVYDVSKQSAALQKAAFRNDFKQLYYVAMTRAIFKLFVPYMVIDGKSISDDYTQLMITNIDACIKSDVALESKPLNLALASPPGTQLLASPAPKPAIIKFSLPPNNLSTRSRFMHSFSSLSQQLVSHSAWPEIRRYGELDKPADEPVNDEAFLNEVPLIPGGVTTGHVLHGVFENVDFEQVIRHDSLQSMWTDSTIMAVVDEQMQQFKLLNQRLAAAHAERTLAIDYRQQMAAWIWHTLRKPLPILNGQSLGMIKPEDRRHEMAFHWLHQEQSLTGYIDLLFRITNQEGGNDYYILDWKSNINAAGYAPEVLADTVMQQHHYDLQFHIYAAAVDDWFRHLGLTNARLKGAIYAFSRGINCESDDQRGIYYHEFSDLAQQNSRTKQQILELTGA